MINLGWINLFHILDEIYFLVLCLLIVMKTRPLRINEGINKNTFREALLAKRSHLFIKNGYNDTINCLSYSLVNSNFKSDEDYSMIKDYQSNYGLFSCNFIKRLS